MGQNNGLLEDLLDLSCHSHTFGQCSAMTPTCVATMRPVPQLLGQPTQDIPGKHLSNFIHCILISSPPPLCLGSVSSIFVAISKVTTSRRYRFVPWQVAIAVSWLRFQCQIEFRLLFELRLPMTAKLLWPVCHFLLSPV
jgi:hypothetical protein